MNNKHVLQMISGGLMLIGFFSIWYYQDAYNYLKPAELISAGTLYGWSSVPFVFKLFWLLPLLGVANIYYGYIKKYQYKLSLSSSVFCFLLVWSTLGWVDQVREGSKTATVATGFYMVGLALLVSVVSIIVLKKEIKSENISSEA